MLYFSLENLTNLCLANLASYKKVWEKSMVLGKYFSFYFTMEILITLNINSLLEDLIPRTIRIFQMLLFLGGD